MNSKLKFLTAFLFIISTINSQTNSLELSLKKNRLDENLVQKIKTFFMNESDKIQKKNFNEITSTTYRVDSIRFSMADGIQFQECYNYENENNISYYTNINNGGVWENHLRVLKEHDENGNVTSIINEEWDGAAWIPSRKNEYQYDDYGNNTLHATSDYDSTGWVLRYTLEYEHDENGNEIHSLGTYLNGTIRETVREFDSNNNLVDEVSVLIEADTLTSHYHTTITYSDDGTLVTTITQNLVDSAWVNLSRDIKELDGNGNVLSINSQAWVDSAWVDQIRVTAEYDPNNNPVMSCAELWNSATQTWMGMMKEILEYNSNGNLVLMLEQIGSGGVWIDRARTVYEFNNDGVLSSAVFERFTDSTWTPANGYFEFDDLGGDGNSYNFNAHKIEKVFYSSVTGISEQENIVKDFSLSQNYPNPFNPETSIKYQVARREMVTLKVYDILGNEVVTLVNEQKAPGTYEVKFNAGNLTSGVYIYRLQTASGFNAIRKSILLK